MDTDTAAQNTPLLVHTSIDEQALDTKLQRNNAVDIKFYDSSTILSVSKEIALGYLVLLTGGKYHYQSCSIGDGAIDKKQQAGNENTRIPQAMDTLPEIDEQTLSLAYAAITDGNVLHTCFGLKSGPSGRPVGTIIGEKQSSSIFCCFPSASVSSIQNNKSKKDALELAEIMKEVKDSESENKGGQIGLRAVQSYVKCFAAIVRYQDELSLLDNRGGNARNVNESGMFCPCPSFLVTLSNILIFSKKLEQKSKISELQKTSLDEIERAFEDLRLCLAEIPTDIVSVAETGVTADD